MVGWTGRRRAQRGGRLGKKVDVAEAVAAKLEAVVAQKAEEIFEVTQERDALRKKLKTTSETIDSLEREWLEMSRAGSSEQEALMEENEELHKIIDQLKSNEKEGFAAAEDEITALKARLHHLEHDQGPTRSQRRSKAVRVHNLSAREITRAQG